MSPSGFSGFQRSSFYPTRSLPDHDRRDVALVGTPYLNSFFDSIG